MIAMAAQGRDIRLSEDRVEGLPQFRDETLERDALLRNEWLCL
jgi:hypothetical protein